MHHFKTTPTLNSLLYLWTFLFPTILFGQSIVIDSCGLNTDRKLNKYEADYFNISLEKQRDNFDFIDKNIAFTYGNFGRTNISKKEYFDRWGRTYYKQDSHVVDILLVLTAEEKIKSGGYDAIIVSWSKIGIGKKHKKIIIDRLPNKNK